MGKKDEKKEEEVKAPEVELKIEILKSDMEETSASDKMPRAPTVEDIKMVTAKCFGKHKLHKDLASAIKAEFDALHPPQDNKATSGVWHCIVGSNFACSVTHETHYACYWSCNNVKFLLWKSKDSPFD